MESPAADPPTAPRPAPPLDPFTRGRLAGLHAELGAAYAACGLHLEAARELRRALALAPAFTDLQLRLATTLRDAGDLAGALVELQALKQSSPGWVPARIHLGITLHALGRDDEAAAEWREALALEPHNRSAKLYLRIVGA